MKSSSSYASGVDEGGDRSDVRRSDRSGDERIPAGG